MATLIIGRVSFAAVFYCWIHKSQGRLTIVSGQLESILHNVALQSGLHFPFLGSVKQMLHWYRNPSTSACRFCLVMQMHYPLGKQPHSHAMQQCDTKGDFGISQPCKCPR